MKKIIQEKELLVSDLSKEISNSKSFIIFEYAGVTANSMSDTRKEMFNKNSSLKVYKNNILNRALIKAKINEFGNLVGPNAIALSQEDELFPLKTIFNLSKENECINIKGSYLENRFLNVEETKIISSLPDRDGMYSMLLSCLSGPIRNLLYALKAVSESK